MMSALGRTANAAALATFLTDVANACPASRFSQTLEGVDQPGLYSWWVDEEGAEVVARPFGATIGPLIYAGQAGATSTRSAKESTATLLSRIQGNHLRGNVGSSTFRQTLTAILRESLALQLAAPKKLTPASNKAVSDWMRAHMSVVTVACGDRSKLRTLEKQVLDLLEPPLNLEGMKVTEVRRQLSALRKGLQTV